MNDSIKISKSFTVGDWKNLRSNLCFPIRNGLEALEVFQNRIQARFIEPIEMIKSNGKNEGEGFTIALISVVLLEFLAAFEQGKIYKTNKEGLSPNEYYSGIVLLKSFLSSSSVFLFHFESKSKIQKFYENIRCGLVHEARTLKNDVIISESSLKNTNINLIYFYEKGEYRLNRDLLLVKIKEHIIEYKTRIIGNDIELRNKFLLKMDEISGLKHVWYFNYGSNLSEKQITYRLSYFGDKYLSKQRCSLEGFQFKYNKRSEDGTSKGNLVEKIDGVVHGTAILILESTLDLFIDKFEKGYKKVEITISTENNKSEKERLYFKSFTCISENITSVAPSETYESTVINGARDNDLPEEYILNNLVNKV